MSAIERLQMQSDLGKVNKWLDLINETDPACRDEVLTNCASDNECLAYYIKRFEEDCK